MEEDFHSPQLSDSPSMLNPGTPIQEMFWSEESDDARFSDSDRVYCTCTILTFNRNRV